MFFYSDTNTGSSKGSFDYHSADANRMYLNHFSNFLFLTFMNTNGTFQESAQARKELVICERKMQYWKKHPNYDAVVLMKPKEKMIADWKSSPKK